jgi:cell division inhibitor SepF
VPLLRLVAPPALSFASCAPRSFDDAQRIADAFRAGSCVTVDLQACEAPLAKRLLDFCSGLSYALDGSLALIERDVLLLAPRHVELSDGAAPSGSSSFFNQY